ncbi:MAG: hypothetical protein EKK45_20715 [Curvibacter sp.]|nr:MAG: hypothetical protein EKK45_20715 [Curvibacter sp.]
MGLVKISDTLHEELRIASDALSRSINAQAEHWIRIGMLSELHPEMRYGDICQVLLRAAQNGDQRLASLKHPEAFMSRNPQQVAS